MKRVEDKIMELIERVSKLESQVEDLKGEIKALKTIILKRNSLMKYTIIILGMLMSFIAAMFGLGWRPP